MGREIERKFLLNNNSWIRNVVGTSRIKQGYLVNDGVKCIRIREEACDSRIEYTLTIKSCEPGMSRVEVEQVITGKEFSELWALCDKGSIEKLRHTVQEKNYMWEVDVFLDGTILAEIELSTEDMRFDRPDWLGEEVTNDKSYYNADMAGKALISTENGV
jgi:adenylate cyclase